MVENHFGKIVKRERKKMKLSLAKVADAVTNIDNNYKINPSYINRLEKGEQSNPSFVIVALLSTVLHLDMREVFKAFGFQQLIEKYDTEGDFSLEELIRLNNIQVVDKTASEKTIRYLNNNEKESFLKLLDAVFNYTLEKSSSSAEKLVRVLEELDRFRQIHQKETNEQEWIKFNYMGETFTIELGSLPKKEGIELGELKEDIKKAIKEEFNKLMDFPNGVIKMKIGNDKWLAQKERYKLTLLSKQPTIVEF